MTIDATLMEIRPSRMLSVASRQTGGARSIFLCHGAGGNKDQWRYQWAALKAAGISTIAWDCYGHGKSPQPRRRAAYAGQALVDDYAAIFDRYAGGRNVLVGHSYGTRLTLCLLERLVRQGRAGLVDRVILIGPPPLQMKPIGGVLRWAPSFVLEWLRPMLSRGFRERAWHPDTDPALIAVEEALTRQNTLFMMQSLMNQAAAPDASILARLDMPILVLTGDSDGLTPPAAGEALARQLPHATFRVIERCGHQAMLEQPEIVNAAILDLA